jgi:predicted MPP superfamily phosphohydrolase
MQALIVEWLAVVVFGVEGLGLAGGAALAVLLAAVNLASVPMLRRARLAGGRGRRASRIYMAGGVATLLIGSAVAVSWLGILPLSSALEWLGADSERASALFRGTSLVLVGGVAAMVLWSFTGGQRRVEYTRVEIPIPGLSPGNRGLRIGHLTDLHIGNGLEAEKLSAMVERANALDADLLVLTGDIFDFDPSFVVDGARRLGALRARLGVFAVLGNHDTYTGTEHVVAALAQHAPAIRVLRDEWVALALDEPLYLAGIEDPGRSWTVRDLELDSLARVGASLPNDGPTLLLVHRPQAFPQAARLGFPVVLAGHTHGGQLALPTPTGAVNLARVMTGYTRGLYQLAGSTLYVNRGIGVAGPAMRFNCRREIATIELL